jgi:hypothetical protein
VLPLGEIGEPGGITETSAFLVSSILTKELPRIPTELFVTFSKVTVKLPGGSVTVILLSPVLIVNTFEVPEDFRVSFFESDNVM